MREWLDSWAGIGVIFAGMRPGASSDRHARAGSAPRPHGSGLQPVGDQSLPSAAASGHAHSGGPPPDKIMEAIGLLGERVLPYV
jgi:hypothetical protein